jgi:putative aldouronate transport system substrate-binding protein
MKKLVSLFLALLMGLSLLPVIGMAEAPDQVSWYLRGGASDYEPYLYEDLKGVQVIQEMANVDIDWSVICAPDGNEIKAQYLLMLASGNYPDVIMWLHNEEYAGGVSQLYNEGIAMELNDVIDQYMPNLKKILEENPSVANDLMNDNGQYLYFTAINPLKTVEDLLDITWWGLLLRSDWLENVGMEVPTNIDEWYNVLSAFKNYDPNGNGQQDEIPFDAGSAGTQLFMPSFGFLTGQYIDPDTGKVGYGEYSEKYRDFLETMNKWYSEGLIANIFDETGAAVNASVTDENIYADLAGSWKGLANYWEQRLPPVLEKNPNANFVAAPWPTSEDGSVYNAYTGISHVNRVTTIISTDCENVEAAARLIDTMYSEEGAKLLTWGIEGETYEYDENGKPYNTEYANETIQYYDGAFARKYTYAMAHISFPRYGGMDFNAATREGKFVDACRLWSESDSSMAYPTSVVLSQDEQDAVTGGAADIGNYIQEMTMKFITGEEPLTNFDTYRDTLQRMGIENLIEAYQVAYDRYVARGQQ